MYTVNGLYVSLEIPSINVKDAFEDNNVMGIMISETSGASLPYVVIIFVTKNDKIRNSIVENNKMKLSIGETKESADTFTIYPYCVPNPNSDKTATGWYIEFGAFLLPINYMKAQGSKSYDGNSLSVAKEIIKESFGKDIKTSITKVDENQVKWIKVNQTSRYFLLNVLEHMDLGSSFPLYSFDKYGNFILKSYNDMVKEGVKYTLVPYPAKKSNQYMYLNNFQVESWKSMYNQYSGYNRYTAITNIDEGKKKDSFIENAPMLAATKAVEKSEVEGTFTMNNIQSGNVHKTYKEAFVHNTNKQIQLSSITGEVILKGKYYRNIAPLDLVNLVVNPEKNNDADAGLYIVETVTTYIDCEQGIIETDLFLTRDNRNYIENCIEFVKNLNVDRKLMEQLSAATYSLKRSYSFAVSVMDGEYANNILNFAIASKNNMLRCFSLFGQTLDFTSGANLVSSLTLMGNSLMNSLCDMIFPDYIADSLRNFVIEQPTLLGVFSNYVSLYVPSGLREIVMNLAISLFDTTDTLNSIAEDNGINVMSGEITIVEDTTNAIEEEISDNQAKVNVIISDFENNTTGLDIPFPIVDLDESEQLLPEEQLREDIANKTVDNLSELGYLDADDEDEFKDILLGVTPINFNLINKINKKAGSAMNYRYWGTFGAVKDALYAWVYGDNVVYTKSEEISSNTRLYNVDYSPYTKLEFQVTQDTEGNYIITYNNEETSRSIDLDVTTNPLAELTSYNIKKSYKDKYRTIPCTKTINAMGNSRIFFVCPSNEVNLKFYINAKKVDLESFEIDLGIVDIYNRKVPYMVYYTKSGYNSTSVLFEVRA